jgi:hypothetical protein
VSSLRDALLGAWELASFVAADGVTGAERHPLGTSPRGLILYTADGFMSAQLSKARISTSTSRTAADSSSTSRRPRSTTT